jgi:hypothetical protein
VDEGKCEYGGEIFLRPLSRPCRGVVDAIGVVKIDQQGTSQIMKSPEGLLLRFNEFLDASWKHMCIHNYATVALRRAGLCIYMLNRLLNMRLLIQLPRLDGKLYHIDVI